MYSCNSGNMCVQDPSGQFNTPDCNGNCAAPPPPSPGTHKPSTKNGKKKLTGGEVLLIIFFCGFLIPYLAFGALYMRMRHGASGADLIPNRELWMSIPGLIKDGFRFTMSGFKTTGASYQQL